MMYLFMGNIQYTDMQYQYLWGDLMQQYMSTYKVTLETKGPLYIGSGKQLGKKEYIHNRQEKEIVVLI